jgi:flagellar hook assembly protein FlgD
LRNTAVALVFALLASLGSFLSDGSIQPAAAASSDPKVVLIVGATHGQTSTYRTRMNAAYAEAIKYSSNVVKVYSPYATWSAVRSALQGASIVIYMGHGNGFPSPYRTTPWPYSQNGFGLNKTSGDGDYNNVYYGEHYIANEVDLAPNAVVLLHHLCYASGNSEPGHAEPTVSVAKQRADNYAAGFLKAGARAVIADGHMGPAYYIRGLFTTSQTIDELWRSAPNFHDHDFSFASVRSPGYTVQMDPENTSSGFYRSVAGRMDLETTDVTGGAHAPTDADPSSFVVPGNASVATDGAGLYGDAELTADSATGLAPAKLPVDTRLRVLAQGATTSGTPVFQVQGIDDESIVGWMAVADLVPRDSTAPKAWEVRTDRGAFSPNGDGRQDTLTVSATLSEAAWWRVRYWQDDELWWSGSGEGTEVSATWSGIRDGAQVPDGTYRWTLETSDGWGNSGEVEEGTVVVDTVAPTLASLSLAEDARVTFSPNADGRADSLAVAWETNEAGAVDTAIRNASGSWVRTMSTSATAGAGSTTWDGRSNSGGYVADGVYTVRMAPRDAAGNVGPYEYREVAVFAALSAVRASKTWFYPQDNDRLARYTTLSFKLARPATVTWQIRSRTGDVVYTRYQNAALAAGTYSFNWYGKNQAGAYVPGGIYSSVVEAVAGDLSITQAASMELNAFAFRVTDSTPARGQSITVTGISAEPLKGYVYLHVYQPGIGTWYVRMSKATSTSYKATIKLRSSSTGTMTLRISALDADGRWQASYLKLPLH